MNLAEIAQQLEGAHRDKNGWRARCPVHGGKSDTSLSLTQKDGEIYVTCWAGCDWKKIKERLNLNSQPNNSKNKGENIVDIYSYHDANGNLLYQVCRYFPKAFKQRRPHPSRPAEWQWKLDGTKKVLYRLPEVLAAVGKTPIYIPEGEKDVELLRANGLVATCNPGGAGKWEDSYSQLLKGADVVLIPDNDMAGRNHAVLVAARLSGYARSIKTVELPGLPEAGDVSEWLQTHTIEEFHDEVRKVSELGIERLEYAPVAKIEPGNIQWLWWPYLAAGTVAMLDGDPGVGKSLFTIALASTLSIGAPLPDQQGKSTLPTQLGATLMFAAEDSARFTIRPRVDSSQGDSSLIYLVTGMFGADGQPMGFTLEHIDALREKLKELRPALVILDPIQAYLGKIDMHRANETRPLMSALGKTAEEFMTCILCVRHPAKPGQGTGKVLMRGLGSVDLIGAARTGLFVEDHPLDKNKVLLMQSKSNLGPKGRTQIFSRENGIFSWVGVTRADAEAICGTNRGPDPYAQLEAMFQLETILASGVPQPSTDVEDQMADHGDISHKTIMRARKRLGVEARKRKAADGSPYWELRLPPIEIVPPPSVITNTTTTTLPTSTSIHTSTTRDTSPSSDDRKTYRDVGEEVHSGKVGDVGLEGQVGQGVIRAREEEGNTPPWYDAADPNF
jgi:hypothetical protein